MYRCCLMLKYTHIHSIVWATKVDTCRFVIYTNRSKRTNEIKERRHIYISCLFCPKQMYNVHVLWLMFRFDIQKKKGIGLVDVILNDIIIEIWKQILSKILNLKFDLVYKIYFIYYVCLYNLTKNEFICIILISIDIQILIWIIEQNLKSNWNITTDFVDKEKTINHMPYETSSLST